jgi:hypothetical protein
MGRVRVQLRAPRWGQQGEVRRVLGRPGGGVRLVPGGVDAVAVELSRPNTCLGRRGVTCRDAL